MHRKFLCVLFLLLSQCSVVVSAEDNSLQRRLFWQARALLLTKKYRQFDQLKEGVKGYSLYPYLLYIKLRQQLACPNEREINHFLTRYQETPLAVRLRADYLMNAARKKEWSQFLRYYQPLYGPVLQCYYLNALLATHQEQIAYQAIPPLWLALHSPPDMCRTVFSVWENSGEFNKTLLWKKLERAIQENNLALIRHLSTLVPTADKPYLRRWHRIHQDPLLIIHSEYFTWDDPRDRKLLLYGMHRLVSKNPDTLVEIWPSLNQHYHLTDSEEQALFSVLAIALARQANCSAGYWLKKVQPAYSSAVLREWRVRHALLRGNWRQTLYWIGHLSPHEQQLPCWRYWRARALAETKQIQAANAIYIRLAEEINYYAVLASQRLKQKYHPLTRSIKGDHAALQKNATIQRAQELYALGLTGDARSEWQWALDSLSISQLQAAAQLAKKWQWYDLAIIGAARAKIHNDVTLRFPLAYRQAVISAAKKLHLNSAWIWAVMRQESAFMWNAQSSVGAQGLMQIMPKTGKMLASRLNLHSVDLFDAELNIHLGSVYLRYLLTLFHGNGLLATAAYNIGPTRIKRYQTLYQRLPPDVWVEILPWKETRDYIKNVSLARSIYVDTHRT